MNMKNTADNYGLVTKYFHWGSAVLLLALYCSVYYRQWFTQAGTSGNWNALQIHLSIGVSVGVLTILRIVWRISNKVPNPENGTKKAHVAAHIGHMSLYAALIIMPITGYLGTGVDTEFFFLFDIPKFENTNAFTYLVKDRMGISFEAFEKPLDFIHKDVFGAWLLWILILGHAIAALYHHFGKKDRTLKKMTNNRV